MQNNRQPPPNRLAIQQQYLNVVQRLEAAMMEDRPRENIDSYLNAQSHYYGAETIQGGMNTRGGWVQPSSTTS